MSATDHTYCHGEESIVMEQEVVERAPVKPAILVVDDDHDVLKSLRLVLTTFEYKVVTAGGAIAALKAENLTGQVAVSGQDAELSACQRIVEGTQTLTIYKPVRDLAETAAEVAVRLAKGEKPDDIIKALNHTANLLDNGTTQVPSIFLTPVFVTADNMAQTVIKDQWHPLEDVYRNLPKDKWPKTE